MNERKTISEKETFFHFIMRLNEQSEDINKLRYFLLTQIPVDLRDDFDLAAGAWMSFSYIPGEDGKFLQALYQTILRVWKQYVNVYPEVEQLYFSPDKRFFDIHRFHINHTLTQGKENSIDE